MPRDVKVGCWWIRPGRIRDIDGNLTDQWRMVAENDADPHDIRPMCDCNPAHSHELEAKGCAVARANAEKLGGPMRIARHV